MRKGADFRASGATNMNDASSRSHAILSIRIESQGSAAEACEDNMMPDTLPARRESESEKKTETKLTPSLNAKAKAKGIRSASIIVYKVSSLGYFRYG